MRKVMLVLAAALVLCSCQKDLEFRRIVYGEPIMPIRLSADSTEVFLTDYLPTLDPSDLGKMRIDGTTELRINGAPESGRIVLYGNPKEVCVLQFDKGGSWKIEIPILPNVFVTQGLTTIGVEDDALIIDPSGKDPQFACFYQNRHIGDDHLIKGKDTPWYYFELNQLKPVIKDRSYLRVYAWDDEGMLNDLLIPLEDGKPVQDADDLTRHDAHAQVLYSVLVDRFYDGNPANDAPLNRPDVDPRVDYQGGDLAGITAKIKDGFFDELGINTLWISPITQNPKDAWGQYHNPETKFSGYHGYWPIFNTKIDDRMGTDAELKELLATAHDHDINVILDYVANHMHINSPTLQAHPDWITDSILPDGRRNFELWDEARLTTWFDKHIPTLDLEREEVCDAMTDTALYWIENYDFDGFRHDACKHIPLNYWRMFTHKMKSRYPDRALWMIGETYGDNQLIGSYVKTGMLNAQFDFNIYHTAIDVLGKDESMMRLAKTINESLASYGYHHTMGNISGNHDKTRFISLAGGAVRWDEDDKAAGWNRVIGVTADGDPLKEAVAFKKALLLEVINMTIPGVPCIYQGDEYGQCGANDPDNRRMMRFAGYNENEKWFLEEMEDLIELRREEMPFIYGDYRELYCDDDVLVFSRSYMGETYTVGINKGAAPAEVCGLTIEPYSYTIKEN